MIIFKTVTKQQVATIVLTILFIVSSALMIHFWLFAAKGKRYTWDDGQHEAYIREKVDYELRQDIDRLQFKVDNIETQMVELIEKINKIK